MNQIINRKGKYYLKTETGYREILASTDKSLIKCPNKSIEFGCCDKPEFCEVKQIITPQIPQSFIEHYISEYNKGNIITEVMVEYEFLTMYKGKLDYNDIILNTECYNYDYNKVYKKSKLGRFHKGIVKERFTNCNGTFITENGEKQFCTLKELYFNVPKINSDNTINIKPIKDSWNRKEVIDDIEQAMIDGLTLAEYRDKWID